MPNSAATTVTLEINGTEFSDINNFNENARPKGKQVKYMSKLGFAEITTEIGFSFTIVLSTKVNFDDIENAKNATVVIEYQGGDRVIFLNCNVTDVGDKSANGEDEITYDLSWAAEERKPEPV